MPDSDSRVSTSAPVAPEASPAPEHSFESASQPSVLASHGKRLAAAALDGVFAVTAVVGGGMLGAFGGGIAGRGAEGFDGLGYLMIGVALGLLAGTLVWLTITARYVSRQGAHNGQTIGKQILGVRAVRSDLAPIRLGQAIGREFVSKGLLISVLAIGLSTTIMLWFIEGRFIGVLVAVIVFYGPAVSDKQRRGLHDRIVDTRVIAASDSDSTAAPTAASTAAPGSVSSAD